MYTSYILPSSILRHVRAYLVQVLGLEYECIRFNTFPCVVMPLDLHEHSQLLGDTVLHEAVRLNSLGAVRFYGSQAAGAEELINTRNKTGATALMLAAQDGHLEIVRCLVCTCGASVDAADLNGTTPLIQAARQGHLEVVRFLVSDGGAMVDGEDSWGATAVIVASQVGHLDIVRFLVEDGRARIAATPNSPNCDMDSMLSSEMDAGPALLHAVRDGHLDIVQYLVGQAGAQVNLAEMQGLTASMVAAELGHLEILRFLVSQGGNIEALDADGSNALMRAAEQGHLEVVRFLVGERGAARGVANCEGDTEIIIAAKNGRLEVARYLASISQRNMIPIAERLVLVLDGTTQEMSFRV